MNQTWENGKKKMAKKKKKKKKKTNLGLVLAHFDPKLVPKIFFVDFTFTRC